VNNWKAFATSPFGGKRHTMRRECPAVTKQQNQKDEKHTPSPTPTDVHQVVKMWVVPTVETNIDNVSRLFWVNSFKASLCVCVCVVT
jgi:hypothetical protein